MGEIYRGTPGAAKIMRLKADAITWEDLRKAKDKLYIGRKFVYCDSRLCMDDPNSRGKGMRKGKVNGIYTFLFTLDTGTSFTYVQLLQSARKGLNYIE